MLVSTLYRINNMNLAPLFWISKVRDYDHVCRRWSAKKNHANLSYKATKHIKRSFLISGPASQNPYPIYDQNLRFSLPYLGLDHKFDTKFMTWKSQVLQVHLLASYLTALSQENHSMIRKFDGKNVKRLTCQYLLNCCLLQAKRRNLPQKSKLLVSGVKLSRASNRITRSG